MSSTGVDLINHEIAETTANRSYLWMIASFAGLFYTSMWLGGKLHIMDNRGEAWKSLLVMVPILAATLVAVSRIMDARHHPFDVITGSLLGVACAIVSYRQYFPPMSESWRKGRAYPIRTWGTEPPRPVDVKFATHNESAVALRNPEADRLDPSGPNERSISPPSRPIPSPSVYGNPANPFASQAYPRRSHDHDPDGNWSSSEDDVGNGFEMQHGYAMTPNPGVGRRSPPFNTNTAYHSQTQAGLVGTSLHSPPDMVVSHADRGRALTDTPNRDLHV